MLDLASSLTQIPETRRDAPWAGYEYVKGWAVWAGLVQLLLFELRSWGKTYRAAWT